MSQRPPAVASRPPAPTEEDTLRRQLAIVQQFRSLLQNERSIAAQSVAAFSELLDDCILDAVLEVHREARTGTLALPPSAPPAPPRDTASPTSADGASAAAGGGLETGRTSPGGGARTATPPPAAAGGLPPGRAGGSGRGPVDIFGQSHPAKATDVVTCRNCGRQVQAGSFAPHLEKCMGKGRAAARAASRRLQGHT
ncbi:hypothetical protein HYH03_007661 [Edaphochlamys debaryana]|uniref:SAGA-associated factor 11 n=1 Tax=Edaphochlamys debaryana TaxID=47281 RepID=A0A836C0B3_9CHLO|nr:hypothetical protein HYH03_007661 [Edaphochlamys debaryana]|eukprot:KAG2494308.1 hypothetical protein HYH03_007661 [Edaphochlamys debaryana]